VSVLRDAQASLDIELEADAPKLSVQEQIHEWSKQLPPWQRDLLRRLTKGALSHDDEDDVLRIILEADDAPTPQPLERGDLPAEETETGPVELREIRDIHNVNLLAEGQTLRFESGINVVFGATGAGKSGYGRLLRRLSQPSESAEVLRSAFDANAAGKRQTAVVQIALGDDVREITVDLEKEPDRVLSGLSIFDAARAPTYVSKPSVIEHVPESLLLLRRLAETQEALQARLKERIAELQDVLPAVDLKPATPAGQLLETVTAQTDLAELERRAALSQDERREIKKLEAALMSLQSDDSRRWEKAAQARAQAAEKVADELERATEKLSDDRIASIADLRARLDEATAAEHSLASDAFSEQSYSGTGQAPWREMWEAARRFVEAEEGVFPGPDPDTACPLCQQALAEEARARMSKLEEFVKSDLREKVASLAKDLASAVKGLPAVAVIGALVDASLPEAPDEVSTAAADIVEALAARVEVARRLAEESSADRGPGPWIPPTTRIRSYAAEQVTAAETQAGLRDETAQQELMERCAELRGRRELAALLPEIAEHVAGLAKIERYKEAGVALRTAKISSQLRKLQEGVLTSRLRAAIIDELTALDLLAAELDVAGKARGGRAAIEFGLRGSADAKVGAVLSEGEQRAVALALFLAESSFARGRSAIVLDDPAALLDRERCEHVAKRLVEEARGRQVIVFTHDLAFVQMLKRAAASSGQELHSQAIRRAYGRAGILGEVPTSGEGTAAGDRADGGRAVAPSG
jgi:ABC-type transport system involved in cytochrome c biogenesis ATPase subunit